MHPKSRPSSDGDNVESASNQYELHGDRPFGAGQSPAFARVVSALQSCTSTAKGVRALCPAHDDHTPSLDVDCGDDGRVLLNCRSAQCSSQSIVTALGLEMRDLFPTNGAANPAPAKREAKKNLKRHETMHAAVRAAHWSATDKKRDGSVTTYEYTDASGQIVGALVRVDFEDSRKKQLRRVTRDGDAWLCRDMPAPKPLYRRHRLAEHDSLDPIAFVEGEKCADALEELGFTATTSAGGAHAPLGDTDFSDLRGKRILIFPDNDTPGRNYCAQVVRQVQQAKATEVLVVAIPDLPEGGDVFDWIEAKRNAGATQDEIFSEFRDLFELACELDPDDVRDAHDTDDGDKAGLVPLGERDPETNRVVLSPRRTLPTGQAFLRDFYMHGAHPTLFDLGSVLWSWQGNRYVLVEDAALLHDLHPWLHKALRYVYDKAAGKLVLADFESNPGTAKAALLTVRAESFLPATTPVPGWLDEGAAEFEPRELLPCKSTTLHLPSGKLLEPTPRLFNFNALDFDFDPNAPEAVRWLAFLAELFGDDHESIDLLQEWFGYCLTADTSLQKMLLLVGPRRSGKGTIARVLTKLVGQTNVVGPTVSSLGNNFGLQPLLGKSMAIVSDARFAGDNIMTVVERLLCISGEDSITVDRKFKEAVTQTLPIRFMFLTNELPRFNDASTALAGRFLILRLTQSFYGKENTGLTDALLAELPGILLWAIDGWHKLRSRGRFLEPESSQSCVQDIEDLSSPVSAFVRERCVVGPGHRVACAELYASWTDWCAADGRTTHTTAQVFGRDLAAAFPGIPRRRCTGRSAFYDGIGLDRGEER